MALSVAKALSVGACISLLHGCGGDEGDGTTPGAGGAATTARVPTTTTASTTTKELWSCKSSRQLLLSDIVAPEKKGMAVDDETFAGCPDEIGNWPHTTQPMKSIRLFAGWKSKFHTNREDAWQKIKKYVDDADASVLIGVENGDAVPDQHSWEEAFQLMQVLGPDRVMGVAFGNEMDAKELQDGKVDSNFFSREGGLMRLMKSAVEEMDKAGFTDVPITTTWRSFAIDKMNNHYKEFFTEAVKVFGNRWVFSFNPYSIWDHNLHQISNCKELVDVAIGVKYVKDVTKAFWDEARKLVGNDDFKTWITEAGWSAGTVECCGQQSIAQRCPDWASQESLWTFYKNMMNWDLSLGANAHVDHLFYFTMRDSDGQGFWEHFGLVDECKVQDCKIQGTVEVASNRSYVLV